MNTKSIKPLHRALLALFAFALCVGNMPVATAQVAQFDAVTRALNANMGSDAMGAVVSHLKQNTSQRIDEGQTWKGWMQGHWSEIEGEPEVATQTLIYEGDSQGIYSGIDRRFGNINWGVGLGFQTSELDASIGTDNRRDDELAQDMTMLFSYLQWEEHALKWHGIFGVSGGELELTEKRTSTGCETTTDANGIFGRLGGEITVVDKDFWDMKLNIGYLINNSTIDKLQCNATMFPQLDANSQVANFGFRADLGKGSEVQPFVLVDVRKTFGDDVDNTAYDVGLGVEVLNNKNWDINVEGRIQLNEDAHRRHTLKGVMAYFDGDYHLEWRSDIEHANKTSDNLGGMALINKWQLGYSSDWGLNTLKSNVYYQVRNVHDNQGKAGVEFKINFLNN